MEKLNYLLQGLPTTVNYSYEVANRLNSKGLKPKRKNSYTPDIVKNVVNGRTKDENVRLELIRLKAECKGRASEVDEALKAVEAMLN